MVVLDAQVLGMSCLGGCVSIQLVAGSAVFVKKKSEILWNFLRLCTLVDGGSWKCGIGDYIKHSGGNTPCHYINHTS